LLRLPAYQLAATVALLCITLQYAGLDDLLRFERSDIDQGSWWLLLTGNFVHLGSSHLWMNMAGFALVVALKLNPEITGYVGYSGTLHGLIMAGSLADLRPYPKSAAILMALVIGKLTWEQISGPLPGSESTAGGLVVVDSHLYGAIGGTTIGLAVLVFFAWRRSRDEQANY